MKFFHEFSQRYYFDWHYLKQEVGKAHFLASLGEYNRIEIATDRRGLSYNNQSRWKIFDDGSLLTVETDESVKTLSGPYIDSQVPLAKKLIVFFSKYDIRVVNAISKWEYPQKWHIDFKEKSCAINIPCDTTDTMTRIRHEGLEEEYPSIRGKIYLLDNTKLHIVDNKEPRWSFHVRIREDYSIVKKLLLESKFFESNEDCF